MYLLDASALYPLLLRLRERVALYVDRLSALDLTLYEIGNIIWKEYRKGRVRNPAAVAAAFMEILRSIERLSVGDDFLQVLALAVENGITFYDAAYLHAARRHGLKLVTEDEDLKKFPSAISVDALIEELGG